MCKSKSAKTSLRYNGQLTTHNGPRTTDNSASLLTPRGRGAVATIRFDGDCPLIDEADAPLFRAANGKPLAAQPLGRIVFGHWGEYPAEEVVVCRTDERAVEIHCHGGDSAARRVLDGLASAGCTILSWHDLMDRSTGRFEAECFDALTRATTERTALILLEQHSGLLRRTIEGLLAQVDIGRGDVVPSAGARIEELLSWARFGVHLADPWRVVLAGWPNVGKSSLINALVGYARAIVFDEPGTTRDVVTVETAFEGWPVQLADTAGIRDDAQPLEAAGIERARAMLADADCRVLLFDVSEPLNDDDRRLLAEWPDAIVVAHKCDLEDVSGTALPPDAIRVSSLTGQGVATLACAIVAHLIPRVPPPGTAVPVTRRQVTLLDEARRAVIQADTDSCRSILKRLLS